MQQLSNQSAAGMSLTAGTVQNNMQLHIQLLHQCTSLGEQHSSAFSHIKASFLMFPDCMFQVLGVQTPGFTAAVRLGAELLKHWNDPCVAWCGPVFLSCPCDGKEEPSFHLTTFEDAAVCVLASESWSS